MIKELIEQIQQSYEVASASWYGAIFPYAQKLFFLLATIEICWAALKWTIQHEDPMTIVMSLFRHIVSLSFFFALLLHPEWLDALIKGFVQVGAAAAQTEELNPGVVLARGALIANDLLGTVVGTGIMNMVVAAIAAGVLSIIVVMSFAIIAAQMLIAIIESKIVIGGGVLLLGFAGSSWTKTYAERLISYAVGVGIKLFFLYLIVGVGMSLAKGWGGLVASYGTENFTALLGVAGASVIFSFIAWHVPSMATSMLSGNISIGIGGLALAAGTAAASAVKASSTVKDISHYSLLKGAATSGSLPTKAAMVAGAFVTEGSKQAIYGAIRTLGGRPETPGHRPLREKVEILHSANRQRQAQKQAQQQKEKKTQESANKSGFQGNER